MNSRLNTRSCKFSLRREISLWVCVFAVMFQLGAPLVQAAAFNSALAATFGGLPNEICTPTNGVIKTDPSAPTHHGVTCEVCVLCHVLNHDSMATLVPSVAMFSSTDFRYRTIAITADRAKRQSDYHVRAIRAPPAFI